MTKATPGPWEIKRHYDSPNNYCPYITVGPAIVRFTQGYSTPLADDETKARAEADARMIAATHDLLASLEALVGLAKQRGGKLHEYRAAVETAQLAIDAARGQS